MPDLNPNIILAGMQSPVPLNDLSSVYLNAQKYRAGQMEIQDAQAKQQQAQTMNDAYRAATGPDGKVDPAKLQASLAANGAGSAIPAFQKANADLQHVNAQTGQATADAQAKTQETLYKSLTMIDGSIAGLAARPDVNENMVVGEMGRLVNAGAFDVQAAHQGTTADAYARNLLSTMPVGNPAGLKQWLVSAGLRTADASKRLEAMLPKYDEQDRGGTINQGTINPLTGQRTDGTDAVKTVTPDAKLQSDTTRRGQDIAAQTAHAQLEAGKADDIPDDQVQSVAQAISEHRLPPLTAYAMSRPGGMKVMAMVNQINPSYNAQDYVTQQATDKNFAQGTLGTKTRAFNASLNHLDLYRNLVANLDNTSSPAYNAAANAIKNQLGQAAPGNADAARELIGKELNAMIVANGGGEAERQELTKTLNSAKSPQQLLGIMDTYMHLGAGQLSALKQQYESGTGRKDFEQRWLSPTAQRAMSTMGPSGTGGTAAPSGHTPPAAGSPAPRAGQGGRPSIDSFFK